ncbi:MAG TPA: DinB family protein [Actinomycetota bacterium]|nr:DinB family protein [Actinomycetota bacterium]
MTAPRVLDGGRQLPGYSLPEKELLAAYLDFHRATMKWKIEGLGRDDAVRPMTASGTNLLGIVKHLAYVERWWFQDVFGGRDCEYPWTDEDPDADFRIEPAETIESVFALYDGECEEARSVVGAASLDETAARMPDRGYTLRWIVVHMIEETARHAGQADILRELIDGRTGE